MQESLPVSGPLSIGQLLDRAFRLYRKKFGLLLLTAAVLLIPYGIISGLLTGNALVGYLDVIENMSSQSFEPNSDPFDALMPQFAQLASFFGVMFLVGIFGLFINAVTTLALTRQEIGLLNGEEITLGLGLRAALSRLWAYIGMALLQILAYIGVSIGISILFFCAIFAIGMIFAGAAASFSDGFGGGFGGSEPSPLAFVGIGIGVVCLYLFAILMFLLPILYFTGRWSVAVPALVDQKLGPIEALSYSWDLTKGHVRRSVIYVVLLTILTVILVSVPAGVIGQIGAIFLFTENPAIVQSITTTVSTFFSVIWIPIATAAYVVYYYDLRVRKEGFDLSQRIDQFESDLGTEPRNAYTP